MEEITSSVPLQIVLHFHAHFSVAYFVVTSAIVAHKLAIFTFESTLKSAVFVPIFVFGLAAELPRFHFGFVGNLNERVPESAAFVLTTLFPAIPCNLYMTFVQEHRYPFEQLAGGVLLAMLALELAIGLFALRALIRRKTAMFFRLVNEESDDNPVFAATSS